MKALSVLFVFGLIAFNPPAHAQRGGSETRGSSSETRGSSSESRGSSYETRSSSSSSSSDSGSSYSGGSSSYDSGSSYSSSYDSGSYDSGGGYYYGGGGGGHVQRQRKVKIKDFEVGQKVMLDSTGDKGVISYIKKTLFGGWACIEFDVDHTEECGFKADDMTKI